MKNALTYFGLFALGFLMGYLFHKQISRPKRIDYKVDVRGIENEISKKERLIDSLKGELSKIGPDTILIYRNHDKIRKSPITDYVSDSLRASIIERGEKRFDRSRP